MVDFSIAFSLSVVHLVSSVFVIFGFICVVVEIDQAFAW